MRGERLTHPRDRLEHRLDDLCDDMEFADLVRDMAKDLGNRPGIERRGIGGDAHNGEATGGEGDLKTPEKAPDVLVGGVVIEHLIDEPFAAAVIDNGQHTERPVVEFIGGDVAGEVSECPGEIVPGDPHRCFFSHWPPPSFAW